MTNQAINYVTTTVCDNQKDAGDKSQMSLNDIPSNALAITTGDIVDKTTLLSGLNSVAHFPEYFAHNWDSAFDCLTDSNIEQLTLDLRQAKSINTEDLNAFRGIIEDAFEDFGKPKLWVISPLPPTEN